MKKAQAPFLSWVDQRFAYDVAVNEPIQLTSCDTREVFLPSRRCANPFRFYVCSYVFHMCGGGDSRDFAVCKSQQRVANRKAFSPRLALV